MTVTRPLAAGVGGGTPDPDAGVGAFGPDPDAGVGAFGAGPSHDSTDELLSLPTVEFGDQPVAVRRNGDRIAYVSNEVRVYAPRPKPWWNVFGATTYEPLVREVGAEPTDRDRAAVQALFLAGAFSNFLREKLGVANIAEATGGGDVVLAALGEEKRTFWSNQTSRAFFGSGHGHFEVSPEAFAHEYTHGLLHQLGLRDTLIHEGVADSMAEYFCYWLAHEHPEAAAYFDWKSLSQGGYPDFLVRSFDRNGASDDVRIGTHTDGDPHKTAGTVRMLFYGLVHDLAADAEPYSPAFDDAMDRAFAALLETVEGIKNEPDLRDRLPAALLARATPDLHDAERYRAEYVAPAQEQLREVKRAQLFRRGLF